MTSGFSWLVGYLLLYLYCIFTSQVFHCIVERAMWWIMNIFNLYTTLSNVHNHLFQPIMSSVNCQPTTYHPTLLIIPSCYGVFHNIYSLSMWWTAMLNLTLKNLTHVCLSTLYQVCYIPLLPRRKKTPDPDIESFTAYLADLSVLVAHQKSLIPLVMARLLKFLLDFTPLTFFWPYLFLHTMFTKLFTHLLYFPTLLAPTWQQYGLLPSQERYVLHSTKLLFLTLSRPHILITTLILLLNINVTCFGYELNAQLCNSYFHPTRPLIEIHQPVALLLPIGDLDCDDEEFLPEHLCQELHSLDDPCQEPYETPLSTCCSIWLQSRILR